MYSPRSCPWIPYRQQQQQQQSIYAMGGNKKSSRRANASDRARAAPKPQKQKGGGSGGTSAVTAIGTRGLFSGPSVAKGPRGITRFRNTEFLADVTAPITAGITNSITVNAANSALFTWLGRIASGFELYRFRRLRIIYSPSCSTATPGLVVGAFEFDALDTTPTTKVQISSMENSARGNVWNKVLFDMDCPEGWFYTSSVSQAAGDQRLNDTARFFLGVFGTTTANQVVGELTVDYDVELAKPDASLVSASEIQAITGSNSLDWNGTSATTTGDEIYTLNNENGAAAFTVKSSGAYNFTITMTMTAASATPDPFSGGVKVWRGANVIATILRGVLDPNSYESTTDYVTAGATFYATVSIFAIMLQNDRLLLSLAGGITSASINRVKAILYRPSIT